MKKSTANNIHCCFIFVYCRKNYNWKCSEYFCIYARLIECSRWQLYEYSIAPIPVKVEISVSNHQITNIVILQHDNGLRSTAESNRQ